jgi:hypothetical protein
MMRRLFWMVAGALLGVTGYRRVRRLARALTAGGRRGAARGRARDVAWTLRAAQFARDVRDGMELYADRHPRLAGRTLVSQQARAERLPETGAGGEDPNRVHAGLDHAKDGRW